MVNSASACPVHGLKDKSMTEDDLVALARSAALKAYAPYSRFHVGCAIESVDGEVVTGANMENACYRLGICAEQSALTAAQQLFGLGRVARIAVAGGGLERGVLVGERTCTPCGGCRQAILEAAQLSGRDVEVLCSNGSGSTTERHKIGELIPNGFGPANLGDAD
jgi:cytidine deaminase